MDIELLQALYCGYNLEGPRGNNWFSLGRRSVKEIYVPPLVRGRLETLEPGVRPAFVEWEDGHERICSGLKEFVYFEHHCTPVFVFDNHNHAFVFWAALRAAGQWPQSMALLHVDQHQDTRDPGLEPEVYSRLAVLGREGRASGPEDLEYCFQLANDRLNVGNFISPALRAGWFSELIHVGSERDLEREIPAGHIFDLDLDFFAPLMDYIPLEKKLQFIRICLSRAALVTVATSPFFIDQTRALECLRRIFDPASPATPDFIHENARRSKRC